MSADARMRKGTKKWIKWALTREHENRRRDESPRGDLSLSRPRRASAAPGGATVPSPTLRVSSFRRTRKRRLRRRHENARFAGFTKIGIGEEIL